LSFEFSFQKSQPLPEDLIRLWEDYQFMHSCSLIWHRGRKLEVISADQNRCCQIFSRAAFPLIRILQVIRLLSQDQDPLLFIIHFLLDLSWDELRTVICSLRGENLEGKGLLKKVSMVALDPTLFPVPFDLIMWDLVCGFIRVMQRILRGELPKNIV
jgi:hypothetical protein